MIQDRLTKHQPILCKSSFHFIHDLSTRSSVNFRLPKRSDCQTKTGGNSDTDGPRLYPSLNPQAPFCPISQVQRRIQIRFEKDFQLPFLFHPAKSNSRNGRQM